MKILADIRFTKCLDGYIVQINNVILRVWIEEIKHIFSLKYNVRSNPFLPEDNILTSVILAEKLTLDEAKQFVINELSCKN